MRLPLEYIGLDEKVVERDFRASFGFGIAYERQAESVSHVHRKQDLLLLAASSFRRAGASALLLDMGRQRIEAFDRAGRLYLSLSLPYGLVMIALTGYRRVLDRSDFRRWPTFSCWSGMGSRTH